MKTVVDVEISSDDIGEYLALLLTAVHHTSWSEQEKSDFFASAKEAFMKHTQHLASRAFALGRNLNQDITNL